jgi:hypothetical protein
MIFKLSGMADDDIFKVSLSQIIGSTIPDDLYLSGSTKSSYSGQLIYDEYEQLVKDYNKEELENEHRVLVSDFHGELRGNFS